MYEMCRFASKSCQCLSNKFLWKPNGKSLDICVVDRAQTRQHTNNTSLIYQPRVSQHSQHVSVPFSQMAVLETYLGRHLFCLDMLKARIVLASVHPLISALLFYIERNSRHFSLFFPPYSTFVHYGKDPQFRVFLRLTLGETESLIGFIQEIKSFASLVSFKYIYT